MSIDRLQVFASSADAEKSLQGLESDKGFPRLQKPARAWFNKLFFDITSVINSLVDSVNILNAREDYGVGDLYLTTADHTPATVAEKIGYGEWQLFGQGKALVGLSNSSSDPAWTKEIGAVFGEYDHTLTTSELPPDGLKARIASYHKVREHGSGGTSYAGGSSGPGLTSLPSEQTGWLGDAHNVTQPSIVVAVWKRVS